MPLVTIEDLKNYMDIDLTNQQQQGAELVLDGLHGELEFLLRRPIEVREFTETWIVPANQNPYSLRPAFSYDTQMQGATYQSENLGLTNVPFDLHLENSPVTEVTSVIRDRPQGTTKTLVEGEDWIKASWGLYVYNIQEADSLTVTYKAGLKGENLSFLKLVLLRAASREVQNLHDDVVGIKDLNTNEDVSPLDVGFSEMEVERLKRYKRRSI